MLKFIKKRKGLYVCVFTLTLTLMLTSFSYAAESVKNFRNLDERVDYLKSMVKYIEENYAGQVTEEQLMEGAYKGVFEVVDPHSDYFNSQEYTRYSIDSGGVFGGIGITIGVVDGKITIIEPIPGTPGEKAGLKAGDVIISVDDQAVNGDKLDKALDLMLGSPGTKVKLAVERKGQNILYFNITRDVIKINPVHNQILKNNIGYMKIAEFNENTSENVEKALNAFKSKNVKGIILDLRNNPGGLLSEAVKVADNFIPKGPVVHINYKNKKSETLYAIKDKINLPVVVLVNGGSASASEIVTGAIQDTKSGTIVGTKTYGKGTVQQTTPITNGGAVKLTIAEYLTPNKRSINGIGIEPDVIINNNTITNKVDVKSFAPMIEDEKPTLGDKGLNVYGAQQRLKYLGYNVEVTGILDGLTFNAIKKFQEENGMHPYGVLDHGTREKLKEKALENNNELKDLQLEKGIEILNAKF